jgi:hypothetical protein
MMRKQSAAETAKRLLYAASRRLHTANPTELLGGVLDASLPLPVGDEAYRGQRLLEPNFSETAARNLSFVMSTGGPRATPADRTESATRAIRWLVKDQFGPQALYWLDGRLEPVRGRDYRVNRWGAWFGSGFDRNGMMESLVAYEWGPTLTDSLSPQLFRLAKTALESQVGLRPIFSAIRCGRSSGSQQLTFAIDYPLSLSNLKPLMERLDLGHRHGSLMSATAFLLGARFTLPPGTATLTLIPTRSGPELRLDINLDALPDPPEQLMPLMRLQMAERPRSLRALDQWVMALTPDGFSGPGNVTVLSIRVRPEMPARVALYLRPVALDRVDQNESEPDERLVTTDRAPNGRQTEPAPPVTLP